MIDEQHELMIQKCVDGELDTQTQQQLLSQLDVLTEGWKILALAYVEEQTWTQSFNENNRVAAELESQAFASSMRAMVSAESQELQCFRPAAVADLDVDRRSRMLTQATCLAIALVGGVLIGDVWRSRQGASTSVATNDNEKSKMNSTTGNGGNLVGNGAMLDVPNRTGDRMQVPLLSLDQYFEHSEPEFESSDIRRQLRQEHGLDFNGDQRFLILNLGDGRRALVPLESYRVSPVGQ